MSQPGPDQAATVEERLRADGDWLGASCVARWRDTGFLFAARVERTRLVLSGIGGKVEPGETFRTAMRRELREETGCELGPLLPPPPRHLTAEARRHPVPEGAAALIAERPREHPTGGILWIAVFLARLTQVPRPVEKVELFAVIPPSSGWRSLNWSTVDSSRNASKSRSASSPFGTGTTTGPKKPGPSLIATTGLPDSVPTRACDSSWLVRIIASYPVSPPASATAARMTSSPRSSPSSCTRRPTAVYRLSTAC